MIITDVEQGWQSKVNFTDCNDVFVGFDTAQDCCEDAGYFISKLKDEAYQYSGNECLSDNIDGYVFDVTFFENVDSSDLDDGGQVCFRLTKPGFDDLYLHLYNSHNGYYSHGFEAKIGGELWVDGGI
ncbi:hypothetical protein VPHK375_0026 [Vibrio phage K375]